VKFAKIVFIAAGVWGIVILTPLFFLVDLTGRHYAPPASYPQFFYGFIGVALAWQVAFLIIGSNPRQYRLLMIPSILEKVSFVTIVALLLSRARITTLDATAAVPDLVLAILFVTAFVKTRSRSAGMAGDR
jgi:hypothetical protein